MSDDSTFQAKTAIATHRTFKNCRVQDLLSLEGNTTVITGVSFSTLYKLI